jgi:hypothetical protein
MPPGTITTILITTRQAFPRDLHTRIREMFGMYFAIHGTMKKALFLVKNK